MFITNSNSSNHLEVLKNKFEQNDEAFFAVAFLKVSGLNLLMQNIDKFLTSGGQISIIAGQNFALTEPEALKTLMKLFQNYPTSKLYLAKAHSPNRVFHPKLYLFKSQNDCTIISGSANITQGGLINNEETSLTSVCVETDLIWIEALQYFDTLFSPENADEVTLLLIKQYELYFEQQKQLNKNSKPVPSRTKSQLAFDYKTLMQHFQKFDSKDRNEFYREKVNTYKKAKFVLDEIANNSKIKQKQFEPLLDTLVGSKEKKHLWHSGSLFRLRRKVYPYFMEFRDLVRYIRQNKNLPSNIVFENAKERVKIIDGASVNYITEIMMTYNYLDFANMNNNPLTVLRKEGGVNIKATTSSYSGLDYEEYCDLVKEISTRLGMHDMLEADSFFNEIYWKIK